MDKVYEATKKVLDKHCDERIMDMCSGLQSEKDRGIIATARERCWRCKKHSALATEISREAE